MFLMFYKVFNVHTWSAIRYSGQKRNNKSAAGWKFLLELFASGAMRP